MIGFLHGVLKWGADMLYRSYGLFGRPLDVEKKSGPCLVIAPHPDDETLGCGAVILAAREAGRDVRIVVVTDGGYSDSFSEKKAQAIAANRREEVLAACSLLKVSEKNVVCLGYPDRGVEDNLAMVEADLEAQIRTFSPSQIFMPFVLDRHPDHRFVARAIEKIMGELAPETTLYEYPIWFSLKELSYRFLHPCSLSKVRAFSCGERLIWKQRAFLAHRSQCEGATLPSDLNRGNWARYFGKYELFFERKASSSQHWLCR